MDEIQGGREEQEEEEDISMRACQFWLSRIQGQGTLMPMWYQEKVNADLPRNVESVF